MRGMAMCKLCDRNEAEPNGICVKCMDELGIIEMPPARRKAAPCVKCNGMKFIRVIPREHTVKADRDFNTPELAPMTLTQAPKLQPKLIGRGMSVSAPSIVLGDGMLETYTCIACGYVEWWCENPTEIPIGPEYMSELVDYWPDAPPNR
jgi:hypothetical protein